MDQDKYVIHFSPDRQWDERTTIVRGSNPTHSSNSTFTQTFFLSDTLNYFFSIMLFIEDLFCASVRVFFQNFVILFEL